MKIAFLTPEYPHQKMGNSGGLGTSIMHLANGLIQQNVEVLLLVYGQKEDVVFEENGITFHCIKNVKLKGLSWYLTRKKIQNYINSLYEKGKIDLVEAPDWTGITSFISTKCPLVIRENGSDSYFCYLDQRKVKFFNRFHEKRALQKADAIISVSAFTGNLTNQILCLNREFTVIPNAINATEFTNENIPEEANSILYFGSLIRKKGLLELPLIFNRVVAQNPNAQLVLIGRDVPDIITGNSSTWAMMQALFSKEALQNVSYMGGVPYGVIKNHIATANVCVFPSFAEALPVSWLEAMAMEKAVVASNVGWATEMIADGSEGFLVDPKNHQEYADKILQLLADPKLRNAFGHAAKEKIVRTFDSGVVTTRNIAFYAAIINAVATR